MPPLTEAFKPTVFGQMAISEAIEALSPYWPQVRNKQQKEEQTATLNARPEDESVKTDGKTEVEQNGVDLTSQGAESKPVENKNLATGKSPTQRSREEMLCNQITFLWA